MTFSIRLFSLMTLIIMKQYNDSLQKDYALWQHYGSIHNYCQHNESGFMTFVSPSITFLICYLMLNAAIMNVVMLNVIMVNAILQNVVMLSAIMLNVIMLNFAMLNVIILNVFILNVFITIVMLNVIMLNIIIMNVVMLNVRAPFMKLVPTYTLFIHPNVINLFMALHFSTIS
jgi:hypothetical protein